MHMSTQLRDALLGRIFHQNPLAIPAALDLALFSTAPDQSGVGGVELSGNNYARKSIALTSGTWTRTGNLISNTAAVTTNTASANWAAATHIALYNGSTPWFIGPLVDPVTVTSGNAFNFAAGALDITIAGNFTDWARLTLLEHFFRGGSITWPESLDFALASTAPTATTAGTELAGNGYARLNVACSSSVWVLADNRMSNGIQLNWGAATGAWLDSDGLDVYHGLGTDRWFWHAFSGPRPVASGNQARFLEDELGFAAL